MESENEEEEDSTYQHLYQHPSYFHTKLEVYYPTNENNVDYFETHTTYVHSIHPTFVTHVYYEDTEICCIETSYSTYQHEYYFTSAIYFQNEEGIGDMYNDIRTYYCTLVLPNNDTFTVEFGNITFLFQFQPPHVLKVNILSV